MGRTASLVFDLFAPTPIRKQACSHLQQNAARCSQCGSKLACERPRGRRSQHHLLRGPIRAYRQISLAGGFWRPFASKLAPAVVAKCSAPLQQNAARCSRCGSKLACERPRGRPVSASLASRTNPRLQTNKFGWGFRAPIRKQACFHSHCKVLNTSNRMRHVAANVGASLLAKGNGESGIPRRGLRG